MVNRVALLFPVHRCQPRPCAGRFSVSGVSAPRRVRVRHPDLVFRHADRRAAKPALGPHHQRSPVDPARCACPCYRTAAGNSSATFYPTPCSQMYQNYLRMTCCTSIQRWYQRRAPAIFWAFASCCRRLAARFGRPHLLLLEPEKFGGHRRFLFPCYSERSSRIPA